jgi:hypothetical protein
MILQRLFASRKRPYIPNRHNFETVEINLSGTRLVMQMPPHSDYEGFTKPAPPKSVNIYNPDYYDGDDHVEEWQREGVSSHSLLSRCWELYGPLWRGRPYGWINFAAVVYRHDTMPDSMSCFNPAHFEQIVLRHAYFSGPANPEFSHLKAPVNWRLSNHDGTWIYYEDRRVFDKNKFPPEDYENARFTSQLFIPLSNKHYLTLYAHYLGYSPAEACLTHMNRLRDEVFTQVQCHFSPDAQQQLQQAQTLWPNATAQASRQPEPWQYPEWRHGETHKGEPSTVIVKPGSPPPIFTP